MSGVEKNLPKFLEGEKLPKGYFDAPNPYKSVKSPKINIGELAKYARENAKDGWTLTKEEIKKFEYK